MSAQILPLLTVNDLLALPDDDNRYELIDGDLLVSRAPHIDHQHMLMNLGFSFKVYLERNPIGRIVPEVGVIFDEHNAAIPDLVFITNERYGEIVREGKLIAAPDLAIGILSIGDEARDRNLKLRLYGKFGVKEYWIVDRVARTVDVYLLGEQGLKSVGTFGETNTLESALLPDFALPVAKVFEF